jgi:hypothetical protein
MTSDHDRSAQNCPPVPDTAMATGSEDGSPGEQSEEQLSAADGPSTAIEDTVAAVRAVRDESVLPVDASNRPAETDPLTPQFRAPGDD